jgi:catechol 2,3-dioxygenase-like lactoylglutathione lyase family enzyme
MTVKKTMNQAITALSLVVRDYDEAIEYYTGILGFVLLEDTPLGNGKRWVRVAPRSASSSGLSSGAALLLAQAANDAQRAAIGNQTGGRVFLFLHTDDFWRDYETYRSQNVHFIEEPREESYATVAVFEDLYSNKWDLIELRKKA